MDEDVSLASDKWVRIMCDFGAEGVWDRQRCSCDIDDLPVSPALKLRIEAWQAWYDRDAFPLDRTAGPFDVEMFSAEGREIAKSVKQELPDWTVIYFDEARAREMSFPRPPNDRAYFEYEIELGK